MSCKRGWLTSSSDDPELAELDAYIKKNGYPGIMHIDEKDKITTDIMSELHGFLERELRRVVDSEQVSDPIRLVWLAGAGLNALAFPHYGSNYIAIYGSAYFVLLDFFSRLWSSPTFQIGVGDFYREILQPKIEISRNLEAALQRGPAVVPQCQERAECAKMMATDALYFLFHHELAHLLNGHVAADAVQSEISTAAADLRSHVIEMDADAAAVVNLIKKLGEGLFNLYKVVATDHQGAGETSRIRRDMGTGMIPMIRYIFVVISAFFSILESERVDADTMFDDNHPHAGIRRFMAGTVVLDRLSRGDYEVEEHRSFSKVLAQATASVISEISLTGNVRISVESFLKLLHPSNSVPYHVVYVEVLLRYWAEYLYEECNRRKLRKVSRLALPRTDFLYPQYSEPLFRRLTAELPNRAI